MFTAGQQREKQKVLAEQRVVEVAASGEPRSVRSSTRAAKKRKKGGAAAARAAAAAAAGEQVMGAPLDSPAGGRGEMLLGLPAGGAEDGPASGRGTKRRAVGSPVGKVR